MTAPLKASGGEGGAERWAVENSRGASHWGVTGSDLCFNAGIR